MVFEISVLYQGNIKLSSVYLAGAGIRQIYRVSKFSCVILLRCY